MLRQPGICVVLIFATIFAAAATVRHLDNRSDRGQLNYEHQLDIIEGNQE